MLNIDFRLIFAELLLWLPMKLPLRLRLVDAPPRLVRLIALLLRLAKDARLCSLLLLFLLFEAPVLAPMLVLDFGFLIEDF